MQIMMDSGSCIRNLNEEEFNGGTIYRSGDTGREPQGEASAQGFPTTEAVSSLRPEGSAELWP